jgi:hypothetical protein
LYGPTINRVAVLHSRVARHISSNTPSFSHSFSDKFAVQGRSKNSRTDRSYKAGRRVPHPSQLSRESESITLPPSRHTPSPIQVRSDSCSAGSPGIHYLADGSTTIPGASGVDQFAFGAHLGDGPHRHPGALGGLQSVGGEDGRCCSQNLCAVSRVEEH